MARIDEAGKDFYLIVLIYIYFYLICLKLILIYYFSLKVILGGII